jgi:hypothetical protein
MNKADEGKYTGWMDGHMNSKENSAVLPACSFLRLSTTAFTMLKNSVTLIPKQGDTRSLKS